MIVSPIKAAEAAALLGVDLPTLTTDEVNRAFREKAKNCHPDHHGVTELERWSRISWAKECLTHWLRQRPTPTPEDLTATGPTCRNCGGTGRIKVARRRFGAPLTMACQPCRGIGTLEPEEDDHD